MFPRLKQFFGFMTLGTRNMRMPGPATAPSQHAAEAATSEPVSRLPVRLVGLDALAAAALTPGALPRPAAGSDRLALLDPGLVFVNGALRERLRMPTRHEAAAVQLEVFRDAYDMCGQRASDFMLARTGHRLEWVIIVLLAAQLLLWGFEYLTSGAG